MRGSGKFRSGSFSVITEGRTDVGPPSRSNWIVGNSWTFPREAIGSSGTVGPSLEKQLDRREQLDLPSRSNWIVGNSWTLPREAIGSSGTVGPSLEKQLDRREQLDLPSRSNWIVGNSWAFPREAIGSSGTVGPSPEKQLDRREQLGISREAIGPERDVPVFLSMLYRFSRQGRKDGGPPDPSPSRSAHAAESQAVAATCHLMY